MRSLLYALAAIPLALLLLRVVSGLVRSARPVPVPPSMVDLIDNPLRRLLLPPTKFTLRHGIQPGMRVLEIGPGGGSYTFETARRVGERGRVTAVDIAPRVARRVGARAPGRGVLNLDICVADAMALPFAGASFDAIYLMMVIGEVPDPLAAMREFDRVIAPGGALAFTELLVDPDYQSVRRLTRMAETAGFKLQAKSGNVLCYSLRFVKA